MNKSKYFKPVHPGEMLFSEFLGPAGISQNKLSIELRVPVTRINDIIKGRRSITADTALRLGKFFGIPAEFWMNLQKNYDINLAKIGLSKELDAIHEFEVMKA